MCREQKTAKAGCPCEGMMETESNKGVRSVVPLETAEKNGANVLTRILYKDNLNEAFKRVKQNGGAAGIDGMTVEEMLAYLKEHGKELVQSIQGGWYKPNPVRRVEIPKPDGGIRMLGVPTVIDRMIQQAIVQVLQPIFEPTFSESSYGFRPRRNAQQAIKRARKYYDEGYTQVVDIDLAKYFDTVNHYILLDMVREQVKNETVIKLIRRRIRQIFWKQWKRIKTKHDNLVRLGILSSKAWEWANSRLGYWRIARSWVLTRSLTNEYLTSIGYDDISKRYEVLHLSH